MSADQVPLPARPAATVLLLRDGQAGIEVFLMRRHRAMEFVGGVIVFPGGGVDDRDRNADIDWYGPPPSWWAERLGTDEELALALVCAAARETFEESGVLFAGPGNADGEPGIVNDAGVYAQARAALADNSLAFGDFLRAEGLVLRADLLRPWANWVTPKEERTRRYDTFFFVGALTVRTPNRTRSAGPHRPVRSTISLRTAPSCCRRPGRSWIRWPAAPWPRCWPSTERSPLSNRTSLWRKVIGKSSSSTARGTTPHVPGVRRDEPG